MVVRRIAKQDLVGVFDININEANKCVCEKCGGICQENDLYGDIAIRDYFTDDELIELAQAKTEGRLVVLPCKVGDTVYRLDGIYSWDIEHIEIYGDEIIFVDDSIIFSDLMI